MKCCLFAFFKEDLPDLRRDKVCSQVYEIMKEMKWRGNAPFQGQLNLI